jgi:hypothetical protein
MFGLFKRKKQEIAAAHRGWNQLGCWLDNKQRQCADWLQERSKQWSVGTVAILLLLFCLIVAGCSTYILWQAFNQ